MSTLPNYYFTFVDVMEFKDVTNEVITSLATTQFHLDIVSISNLPTVRLDSQCGVTHPLESSLKHGDRMDFYPCVTDDTFDLHPYCEPGCALHMCNYVVCAIYHPFLCRPSTLI